MTLQLEIRELDGHASIKYYYPRDLTTEIMKNLSDAIEVIRLAQALVPMSTAVFIDLDSPKMRLATSVEDVKSVKGGTFYLHLSYEKKTRAVTGKLMRAPEYIDRFF